MSAFQVGMQKVDHAQGWLYFETIWIQGHIRPASPGPDWAMVTGVVVAGGRTSYLLCQHWIFLGQIRLCSNTIGFATI